MAELRIAHISGPPFVALLARLHPSLATVNWYNSSTLIECRTMVEEASVNY